MHEALQPVEPREVEVVGRLVEAVEVVVLAEERGEPRLGRLAAGKRPPLVFLRQVADGEIGRAEAHAAALGLLEPGEQPEQRRLADSVRADEADPRAGGDGQRDAAEDLVDAVRDGDVDKRDRRHGPPDERDRHPEGRRNRGFAG